MKFSGVPISDIRARHPELVRAINEILAARGIGLNGSWGSTVLRFNERALLASAKETAVKTSKP